MEIMIMEIEAGYEMTCNACDWRRVFGPRESVGKFFDAAQIHSMQGHKQKMYHGSLHFAPIPLYNLING